MAVSYPVRYYHYFCQANTGLAYLKPIGPMPLYSKNMHRICEARLAARPGLVLQQVSSLRSPEVWHLYGTTNECGHHVADPSSVNHTKAVCIRFLFMQQLAERELQFSMRVFGGWGS